MKKVLVDSSVWVSLFAQDVNYKLALGILEKLMDQNVIIVLPAVVYVEVVNSLVRLKQSEEKINFARKTLFNNKKIWLCQTTLNFWVNEITALTFKISLKSLDLIILGHALKFDADLITFDKRMDLAYKKIREKLKY
jgi:predicted nucleic acid-binding protein